MFILFMGTSLLIWVVFGFVRKSIDNMQLNSFDRQAGALLGAVKGAILCTLITMFAVSLLGDSVRRSICTSQSGNYIARGLTHVGNVVPQELAKVIQPYIDDFQRKVEEHQGEIPPTQPGGIFSPGQPDAWGNTDVTQSGNGPTERVGQLQPATSGWQPPQPVYNGTTGQWEYPQPLPQQPAQPAGTNNGQFQVPQLQVPQLQVPQIDWRSAAQKATEDVTNQIFNGNR